MLLFVAVLIAATFASGVWCVGDMLPRRIRAWWQTGRPVTVTAILLAAVMGIALGLRFFFVPPHHAMYLDEPWYAEAACNLARLGRLVLCQEAWSGTVCISYQKALGWPVVISPWTIVFGCDTSIGIHINRVLGAATVLLVAVATRCAGGRWWQSVFAAAVLAIHPVHVAWSATGETNVSAAATLLAGLSGALVYLRTGRWCGAALAISGLGLCTAIRPESCVPAVVAAFMLALAARTPLRQRLLVACAIGIVCAAAAVSGLHLWTMNTSISNGAFLSIGNIVRSALLVTHGASMRIHAVMVLLAIAAAAMIARSPQRGAVALLVCTATAAALVVLTYDRFHERMLLGATVAVLPLSGLLFDWRSPRAEAERGHALLRPLAAVTVVSLLFLLWRHALISASVPAETQVLETRIASRVAQQPFATDALFITEQPTILAASGMVHVMSTEEALRDEQQLRHVISAGRTVYFLRDMYCEPGFQGMATPPLCSRMLERFALSPVAEERLHNRTYSLSRVSALADN